MTISRAMSASKSDIFVHQDDFRNRVLGWVRKMQTGPTQFKMNAGAEGTIFTTCFSLFIFDLFGEVSTWPQKEKDLWIDYINSFQDKDSGYFLPDNHNGEFNVKLVHQLTAFCLSALDILGTSARYNLNFLSQWKNLEDVYNYLEDKGCSRGLPGSGNMGMFLAIFLIYEYERTGESHLLDKINAWFKFHNETQNQNGFWGSDLRSHYLHGLQNGFHQFIIYFYQGQKLPRFNRIVDVVLMCQDRDGFFAPTPGGEACYDYDAIHILVNAYRVLSYKRGEIAESLEKVFYAILGNQNGDGGFCQSRQRPNGIVGIIKHLPFYVSGKAPYLWYYKLGKTAYAAMRKKTVTTEWVEKGRRWDESNLFDTWFRCLSLAEIVNTIDLKNNLGLDKANFHKVVGIGFFKRRLPDSSWSNSQAGEIH